MNGRARPEAGRRPTPSGPPLGVSQQQRPATGNGTRAGEGAALEAAGDQRAADAALIAVYRLLIEWEAGHATP